MTIDPSIFKAYDIRGVVGTSLTIEGVALIGRAIGSHIENGKPVCVGRDGRLSGPSIVASLIEGITSAGIDVVDVGQVTSPALYFSTHELKTGNGVMVTGSHNPPEYNGLKIVLDGHAIYGPQILSLLKLIETEKFNTGHGNVTTIDINERYMNRIKSDIKLTRPIKVSIDCGNGVAGLYASEVFKALGCDVSELFCDIDGNFPNHHPDPSKPDNLKDIIRDVSEGESELGLAFDGDADRLGVVTKNGEIIYPDRLMMMFADDLLTRHQNAEIIYDVKCSRDLGKWITKRGGRPKMWKTGHSLIKAEMKRSNILLGGEMSGHFFFKERWFGFDDGIYAGARLLEYLSKQPSLERAFKGLPKSVSTPELQIQCAEGENFSLTEKLKTSDCFSTAVEKITMDGIRVEYQDGFGLARASNTTPSIVLRFEADTQAALKRIINEFQSAIVEVAPHLSFPKG
ncbi:MAG: phosphomannomutase/phosphoglucomutase [Burkholderiales bacterium]|nr:phosphomannomutase/phosphoglucomutase [Burkholderiales bacterium]OUT78731.1 MAG: phosphomannomutase/phosphoglucomutase [Betaproteobacteria bacterium TMED22]|tara:strand:- start:17660 stop:19030 length:1371 start_codon:yes stop_codon:yes gene_type:complete